MSKIVESKCCNLVSVVVVVVVVVAAMVLMCLLMLLDPLRFSHEDINCHFNLWSVEGLV